MLTYGSTDGIILLNKTVFKDGHMNIADIVNADKTHLYFTENGTEKTINLKNSADTWWDMKHKASLKDILLRKKQKNIYVGEKFFCIDGISYIKFFDSGTEYYFEMYVSSDELREKRHIWDKINIMLNKQGYWLFDNG